MASDLEQDTHAFLVQLDTFVSATRGSEASAMLAALSARERKELLRQLARMIDSNIEIEAAQ